MGAELTILNIAIFFGLLAALVFSSFLHFHGQNYRYRKFFYIVTLLLLFTGATAFFSPDTFATVISRFGLFTPADVKSTVEAKTSFEPAKAEPKLPDKLQDLAEKTSSEVRIPLSSNTSAVTSRDPIPSTPGGYYTGSSASSSGSSSSGSGSSGSSSVSPSSVSSGGDRPPQPPSRTIPDSQDQPPSPPTRRNSTPFPPQPSVLFDLGVTDGQTRFVNIPEMSNDGIKRYNVYLSWRQLEDSFVDLDWIINEATKNGVKVSLLITITNVHCVETNHSDEFCFGEELPRDINFSRTSSKFDDEIFIRRLRSLVKTIMQRYDSKVLTHVYVGNEVNSYLMVVKRAKNIDHFPGFFNLISRIHDEVKTLPQPRAQFGTVFNFFIDPYSDIDDHTKRISQVGDIAGFTVYPTAPNDSSVSIGSKQDIALFLNKLREITSGRKIAISEIGFPSAQGYGGIDNQKELTLYLLNYLKENPNAFEYIVWFSMYDNPNLAGVYGGFFESMGLKNINDQKKPVYNVWARQTG